MSNLVANHEGRFSRDEAQLLGRVIRSYVKLTDINVRSVD